MNPRLGGRDAERDFDRYPHVSASKVSAKPICGVLGAKGEAHYWTKAIRRCHTDKIQTSNR